MLGGAFVYLIAFESKLCEQSYLLFIDYYNGGRLTKLLLTPLIIIVCVYIFSLNGKRHHGEGKILEEQNMINIKKEKLLNENEKIFLKCPLY